MIRNVGSPIARVVGKRVFRPGYPTPEVSDISLQAVEASTVFDLDATISDSYPGTGTTWANLVAAPADGAAQGAYDIRLGNGSTSTGFPTFTGDVGSAAAYWLFDGSDYFSKNNADFTAFLQNLHKTTGGQDYWALATLQVVDSGDFPCIFATQNSGANAGVSTAFNGTRSIFHRATNVSVTTTAGGYIGDRAVIVSHSHSANQTRIWVGDVLQQFSHSYGASTTNPVGNFYISGGFNGTADAAPFSMFTNGTRMYSFAMGNEYLDNTKAAALIAALGTRHGRNYLL